MTPTDRAAVEAKHRAQERMFKREYRVQCARCRGFGVVDHFSDSGFQTTTPCSCDHGWRTVRR